MPGSYIYQLLSKCMITTDSKDKVIELIEKILSVSFLGRKLPQEITTNSMSR